MTRLQGALAEYLTIRRALGYKLERAAKLLAQLRTYLKAAGADTITTDQALAWATLTAGSDPSW
jgi:hypothetical protein